MRTRHDWERAIANCLVARPACSLTMTEVSDETRPQRHDGVQLFSGKVRRREAVYYSNSGIGQYRQSEGNSLRHTQSVKVAKTDASNLDGEVHAAGNRPGHMSVHRDN